jgi:acyl-CoA synthetase (NDP forming)/GNAT superfamily N-acetyltransferase
MSGQAAGAGQRSQAGPRAYALLTDGSTVEIRPARPGDAEDVRAMHAAMSPDNLYLRFFSLSPLSAGREAQRICRPPGPDHAALLAWLGGRLVGVASYEPTPEPGVAEVAFAVPDDMHGRGIATLLLEHLVSVAQDCGVEVFTGEALAENRAMLSVFADAGLPVRRRRSDGLVRMEFPLPEGGFDPNLDGYLDRVAARESRADAASLRHLLQPSSVAVIGAGRRRGSVGREILHNIVTGGFAGAVYPVNPRARSMEGLRCLASVADLPDQVDLAVVAVPAAAITEVAEQCGQRGVRSLVVIASGLGTGGADLLAICRRYGMRLVGPNSFGVAVPPLGLDATFDAEHPRPGSAGLVVQSGGIGVSLLRHLSRLGIGVSSFASVGDKYDVSSNDLLMWWEQDRRTKMAVLYMESFGSPRKFARTARRLGQRMPVLAVMGGRSSAGQRAAASHTAAAATPVVTQEALFAQAGIIAVAGLGELVETMAMLACQPLPAGDRVAIVSNAGGAGVLAADACGDEGLRVAALSRVTRRRLARLLPAGSTVTDPVDTTAGVGQGTFRTCLEHVAADEGVDAVLAIAVPTAIGDLTQAIRAAKITKPVAAVLLDQWETVRMLRRSCHDAAPGGDLAAPGGDLAAPGGDLAAPGGDLAAPGGDLAAPGGDLAAPPAGTPGPDGFARLEGCPSPAAGAVPVYAYPEAAVRALGHTAAYRAWRGRQHGQVPELTGLRTADARALIAAFLHGSPDGGWLPPAAVSELLACYRIALVPSRHASGEEQAVRAAAGIGGPVVLKAEVEGLIHKTEAGAVKLGLHGEEEVRAAFRELAVSFGRDLTGVLVQPMLSGGAEVLIGVVQEPVFGPLVVFGLGGVATEVLGDHVARLTPLTNADADDLIHGVHAAPLLFGHRDTPAVDTAALTDMLLRVSRLADDLHEVAELDLNPVIATQDGAHAVDARIRVCPAQLRDPFLRQLR